MPRSKINLLVVAHWPLGGIRTYIKYTYKYLSKDRFDITILARKTIEEKALAKDAEELGAKLIMVESQRGLDLLIELFKILTRREFHIIQSHGIISAAYVYLANFYRRIPHVLTIHGIIEERLMGKGLAGLLKRKFLSIIINSVTVLYGVSNDIMEHIENSVRIKDSIRKVVILNGIDIERFEAVSGTMKSSFRQRHNISEASLLIGFVGRFMPQKGFDYLIEALEIMERKNKKNNIQVLAVGSGDYLESYQRRIKEKGLIDKFVFVPFQRDIIPAYMAVDVVVMPSVWEAYGLQAAEAIVLGIPIIVTDCIGLREAVRGTPAITVPPEDPMALAEAIYDVQIDNPREIFQEFRKTAIKKFDVRQTSEKLIALFDSLGS